MDIGVVGIGIMGKLVVELLVRTGENVLVYDVVPQALQQVEELGATPVDSLQAVAKGATMILLLLPGPPQIEAVVNGEEGLLSAAREKQIIIDMSTVDPETTRRMGARAKEAGVSYMDAPILGRPSAVGNWVLPVGGEADVLKRSRPVLEKLGREIIHVGPLGAGNTLKLLNALMFSAINALTAEMMAISQKAGLSPKILFDTIAASEAATVSGLFKEVGSKMVQRDFTPTFPIDLLCKDNGLAVAMADSFNAPAVLGNAIQVMNNLARSKGLGKEDTSALIKVYEQLFAVDNSNL